MSLSGHYRSTGNRGGCSQHFRDRKMNHHSGMISPAATDSQYKMSLSECERAVYDSFSTVLATFNEEMRAQVTELQNLEDERVQNTRLESYVIHRNVSKRPATLYQIDLRTNKQNQVPAAEIANSQAKKIWEQAEHIKSLQDKLNKSEQAELEHRAALGELRIKNHVQETMIARLEASLTKGDIDSEQVQVNGHSDDDCRTHFGFGSISEAI